MAPQRPSYQAPRDERLLSWWLKPGEATVSGSPTVSYNGEDVVFLVFLRQGSTRVLEEYLPAFSYVKQAGLLM